MKTPLAAIVAIPPVSMWLPIQAIRRVRDPHVDRWMPHVTLLYPFLDDADEELLENVGLPIDVRLERFSYFEHGGRRATLWLAPEPKSEFVALQASLQRRFPACDDVSKHAHGFTPHLSVGEWDAVEAPAAAAALEEAWQPLAFRLEEIALIRRTENGPFGVERRFELR